MPRSRPPLVIHQPLVDDRGRCSQKLLSNGFPFQLVGHSPEIVDQRIVEAGRPAQRRDTRGLAGLLLELADPSCWDQEQRVALLGAFARRRADRLVDPRRHHVGGRGLLVAVGMHSRMALARARPSSAGTDRRPCRATAARAADWRQSGDALGLSDVPEVRELQPRARAGKVEQVGVIEEIPWLLGDGDAELGGERADQRARQACVGACDVRCKGRTCSVSAEWHPAGRASARRRCSSYAWISASMPSMASGANDSF